MGGKKKKTGGKKKKKNTNKKKNAKPVAEEQAPATETVVPADLDTSTTNVSPTPEDTAAPTMATPAENQSPGGKKRKRKKRKKKMVPRGFNLIPVADYTANGQTYPPSKRVCELYPADAFPVNQTMDHPNGEWRKESTEKIELEETLIWSERLQTVREAAEIHRQVRQDAQRYIQPGMDLTDICNYLEGCNKRLLGFDPNDPLARSWGFPTGCSVNDCAAHYTPNPGDKKILKSTDIIKFDFGTQINGHIIDCAWTMSFDPMHDTLMEAVKDATNTGVRTMGIDVRLCDVGAAIQEAMESYSCTYDGKEYPVKCIQNLSGHSIGNYRIHAGNMVPLYDNSDQTKMIEGEFYAIETFGSTGRGRIEEDGECSHFMKDWDAQPQPVRHQGAQNLLKWIDGRFGTLAFCRRWIQEEYGGKHLMSLNRLVNSGVVKDYPPLCDIPGCYTAQYEHTILLRPTCKEIVSRGNDY